MKSNTPVWLARRAAIALMMALLGGCSALLPSPPPPDNIYLLEANLASLPTRSTPAAQRGLVLAVSMPRARAGFDTAQMVWVRQAHGLEVYARNRWADTPARMLAPLLAQALERSGVFHAVVPASSTVSATLRHPAAAGFQRASEPGAVHAQCATDRHRHTEGNRQRGV